jgi:hypothetical protein
VRVEPESTAHFLGLIDFSGANASANRYIFSASLTGIAHLCSGPGINGSISAHRSLVDH